MYLCSGMDLFLYAALCASMMEVLDMSIPPQSTRHARALSLTLIIQQGPMNGNLLYKLDPILHTIMLYTTSLMPFRYQTPNVTPTSPPYIFS